MKDYFRPIAQNFRFLTYKNLAIVLALCAVLIPVKLSSQNAQPPNCAGGTLNSPVRMEIFSDFQCSGCRDFYLETVSRVLKTYSANNKVCIIYHEYPLQRHRYGRIAARYALAAQRIGKRQWLAVMDALYRKQEFWSQDGNIEGSLKGVLPASDLARMKTIMSDRSIEATINQDIALGEKKGVTSTPTVFVTSNNKTEKVGYLGYEVWKDYFEKHLK